MIQLKDLVITIMYLYIFVFILPEKNLIATSFLIILFVCYFTLSIKNKEFNKNLKRYLSAQKERFINIISHDLRIPVIAQIRALEIINNERQGSLNDVQKSILLEIENSCKCVYNLMSLMINTYKMENNSYKLNYEKFNLSEAVISCFDELLLQAQEKNITFEYKNMHKNPQITADKLELKKVILNILSDFISNAQKGQKISVITNNSNNNIRLIISGCNNLPYKNSYINSYYASIGQDIRLKFCKKIIENHRGKMIHNMNNSFGFEIPQFV